MALDSAASKSLGLGGITGQDPEDETVDVPGEEPAATDEATITANDDGSETIDFSPIDDKSTVDHDDNLADYMEETDLNSLAEDIVEWVKEDIDSRSDWESMLAQGLTSLGLKIEDRNFPFPGAAGVFDPILLEAVIRWHSTATAELLPAGGQNPDYRATNTRN